MKTTKIGALKLALLSSMLAALIGCGGTKGGTSGGGGGSTNPTVTSVSTVVTPSSITMAQTASCSATVIGTGNPSQSVTWTSTNGTINSAGVFTPTATGSATCTATSTQDTTKSGSATLTVTAVPPTITSVALACNPSSITTAQTSNCTATVVGTGAFSSAVTYSASSGSVSPSGVVSSSSAATITVTATSTQDPTKFGSATVTVTNPPITITSVNVSCTPSTISAADTATCTAVVNGTGNFDPRVTWTATGGTVSALTNSTATFTPSGAGTGIVTATSEQDPTKSGMSAAITITAAVPKITSISLQTLYADAEAGFVGMTINGSDFQAGGTFVTDPVGIVYSSIIDSPTQLSITLGIDTPHTSPGWFTIQACQPNGGTCSNPMSLAFLGNQNMLALSASGELYFDDEGVDSPPGAHTGYIRQYKSDGTPDGTAQTGFNHGIAVDDKTGDVVVVQNGTPATIYIYGGGKDSRQNGFPGMAAIARNGNGCITQPYANLFTCLDLTSASPTPPLNSLTVGSQPVSAAAGLFGTETDAFAFSRDGNPTLWNVNISGGNPLLKSSVSLTGMTPAATLYQKNPFAGGWHVVVFDSGPASGTAAALSTADNLLLFVNTSTMTITKSVTLTGVPFRIAADKTDGKLVVAFADPVNVRTTFASVDPTTGAVTPLTTTSDLLAVGFQISPDGKSLYSCMRDKCEVLPNK